DLLNDSKQLTDHQRRLLRPIIQQQAICWAVAQCSNHEIDQHNILQCSIMAMHRAIDQLDPQPQHIIVDGNRFTPLRFIPYQTVVKGDGKYMSIAAASILAKTYRDDLMISLHEQYPQYGWNRNMGYPTKQHRKAVMQYGHTPLHRTTFNFRTDDIADD
ncbi:MAG: ribonuclease HII, partial [Paludibacteraceae bacterium]|nr:ribonuclease HII [Paludibacteraceae bacterium]